MEEFGRQMIKYLPVEMIILYHDKLVEKLKKKKLPCFFQNFDFKFLRLSTFQ